MHIVILSSIVAIDRSHSLLRWLKIRLQRDGRVIKLKSTLVVPLLNCFIIINRMINESTRMRNESIELQKTKNSTGLSKGSILISNNSVPQNSITMFDVDFF